MLEVHLLGAFQVRHDKKIVNIASRPAQSLFAYLILNAGTAHRREKLAGLLWPDSLEETARDNLRHALWRMRKALESISSTRFLQADDLTIGFKESSDYWLDAAELEKLSGSASADELISVLSDYRGELLPGFYDEWVVLGREHLNSIFEHHMARLMSLLQNEKRWLDVLDWGERWIKLGRKPEPAYRALMSAHAAKGDMFKVAATYERCVESLKEFDIEPSEQTRELYQRLKTSKEKFEGRPVFTPVESRRVLSGTNLPNPITSFIGRGKEVQEVVKLVGTNRLVTLTGSGGVGKTRLAIQSSNQMLSQFKDGVWWAELAPLMDEALVPQAVAQALGVRESPSEPVLQTVKGFLREKQLLLVLDNCEHLINACAQVSQDLLTHCADLTILTTSREALDIMGETEYKVQPLNMPAPNRGALADLLLEYEGIRLFVERAKAKSGFVLTEHNASAVLQICQQLDGIPLALELAARRIKSMSPAQILERLSDRFDLLTQGNRTAPQRHQTLRAAIDWSYDLLSEEEQTLFRRLAVFAGGWTLEEAQAICSGDGIEATKILDLLTNLVDKSLAIMQEQNGETRYQMLETIREYARERLAEAVETDRLCVRHYDWFFRLTEQASLEYHTPSAVMWFDRFAREHDNLRAALDWSLRAGGTKKTLQLSFQLLHFWDIRSHWSEGRAWFERALAIAHFETEVPAPQTITLWAQALLGLGRLAWAQGELSVAATHLEKSIARYGDLARIRPLNDLEKLDRAQAVNYLGFTATHQSDYARARACFEEALSMYQELEQPPRAGVGFTLCMLGGVARDQGQYEQALRFGEESEAIGRRLQDTHLISSALDLRARAFYLQGDLKQARPLLEESVALSKQLGYQQDVIDRLDRSGLVAYYEGDYRRATDLLEEALALSQTPEYWVDRAMVKSTYAAVALAEDDPPRARALLVESLAVMWQAGMKWYIIRGLEIMAAIDAAECQPAQAARLFGAAAAARESLGVPLPPSDRPAHHSAVESARRQLGKGVFAAAWEEGCTMVLGKALEFALQYSG